MTWWLWALLGLALLGLELATPGGFFWLFFAIGAMVVAALAWLGVDGVVTEWLVFSVVSVVSLLSLRGPLRRRLGDQGPAAAVDVLVGEVAVPLEDLAPGAVGKAELRGSAWTARNGDVRPLARGERTRVARVDGLTL